MDRWRSRGGKSQRGEEKKREDQRGERVRRKKMQVREKVGKSRFTVVFQWFYFSEGRKVGSLKRRVRSHVVRWDMKKCTPLWREARLEVKKLKTLHVRTTFGTWDVEKVHALVVRSTMKHISKSNVSKTKNWWLRNTFASCDVEQVYAAVARSRFPSQNLQNTTCTDHFWTSRCWKSACCWGAKHIWKSKVSKTEGFYPFLTFRFPTGAH